MPEYDFGPKSDDFRYFGYRGNLHVVEYLRAGGYNIMPLRVDGSKAPKIKWSEYQLERVPQELIDKFFVYSSEPSGIGVICGQTSGFLEILDFDYPNLFLPWCRLVAAELGGEFVRRLVVVQTPTGGWHVYYRCMRMEGNRKLALDASGKVRIETRGQGGQAVMPGSPNWTHPSGRPYRLFQGRFHEIPLIGAENHRKVMFEAAVSFDQSPPKPAKRATDWLRKVYNLDASPSEKTSDRPGDDFNERADWAEDVLEPAGWTLVRETCGVGYWQRPDKVGKGPSASVAYCKTEAGKELMRVFSSNARPLEEGQTYDRFSAYAHLHHGGDFFAAAEKLASLGYGRYGDLAEHEQKVNDFIKRAYE
jgi:hypothetical protein